MRQKAFDIQADLKNSEVVDNDKMFASDATDLQNGEN